MASRKPRNSQASSRGAKTAGVRGVLRGDGAKRPRPSSVEDLYEGKKIHPAYIDDKAIYAWFQKRHSKGLTFIDEEGYYRLNGHEWKVPYGVRLALKTPLVWSQIANRYPFYVTWQSPKTGKRMKKYFMSMPHAIIFVAEKAQYVDEDATIVSRHGYHIPPKLRGKFPRRAGNKNYYWCTCCMQPRRFFRVPDETFFAIKKEWNETKAKYEFMDRKLAVLECAFCGMTNRDSKWRASNQPFEVRRFKQGVRRAKRRR